MSAFRTRRPLLVDAQQCTETKTIATDLGFCNVQRGDWIIRGEDGECYVVDDAFFNAPFPRFRPTPGRTMRKDAAMARKSQKHPAPQLAPASPQSDVAFAQLLLVTMQIYGNCKPYGRGTRQAH